MNERCGCGSAIENVDDIELVREWRRDHRHEAPALKQSPSGGSAQVERAHEYAGFAQPWRTEGI